MDTEKNYMYFIVAVFLGMFIGPFVIFVLYFAPLVVLLMLSANWLTINNHPKPPNLLLFICIGAVGGILTGVLMNYQPYYEHIQAEELFCLAVFDLRQLLP